MKIRIKKIGLGIFYIRKLINQEKISNLKENETMIVRNLLLVKY
jgi:hypothetical protein